jgi:hypothetical protein
MGLTFSAPLNEDSMSNERKKLNIKKLANSKLDDNILETLNLSELTPPAVKLQMPLVGGNDYTSEGEFAYNFPKKQQREERYNNYNLFNIMAELEAKKNIVGGNLENEEKHQSSTTDPGMSALKSILVDEMNKYKNNNSENGSITGGGDCGCSGNNNVLEGGKKKSKKSKKSKKVMKGGISSSSSDDNSYSGENNFKVKREEINTSNEELEENALSIFNYNSSDTNNQTSSEKNFRMLRRKV